MPIRITDLQAMRASQRLSAGPAGQPGVHDCLPCSAKCKKKGPRQSGGNGSPWVLSSRLPILPPYPLSLPPPPFFTPSLTSLLSGREVGRSEILHHEGLEQREHMRGDNRTLGALPASLIQGLAHPTTAASSSPSASAQFQSHLLFSPSSPP